MAIQISHRRVRASVLGIVAAAAVFSASLGAQAPDRSKPPVPGPAPALKPPTVLRQQLSNGIAVWLVEQREVPVVQVNLLVASGSADDPANKFGAANLMASMLMEGAGSRSSLELADAVDFLGADLNATSGSDSTVVRLHTPVARLADALPLMADVAQRPRFENADLERLRQQRLTSVLQARDDPGTIGALAFARVLFGTTHRFGTATMGTAQTIRAFTIDDLRAFYTATFRPDNSTLIIVGDVTAASAMPLLERSFGSWKPAANGPVSHVKQPAAPLRSARAVYLIDKPGAPQSQIRIGMVGVARSTPDYFPLTVMNTILGGAFSSRLNLNLRETHGYTYGAQSFFDMRLEPGSFTAFAGVQTDKTADALKEFFNEFTGMTRPVPADELERAKNYIALGLPSEFETTAAISRKLEEEVIYHLPTDYFASYDAKIAAVTGADVQRMVTQYLKPDRMAIVIVGDRQKIEAPVKALNLGALAVLTVDEVFGTFE